MKRKLKNAINILEELLILIKQYFPILTKWINNLTDTRHQSHITYDLRICLLTQILAFCSPFLKLCDEYRFEYIIRYKENAASSIKKNLDTFKIFKEIINIKMMLFTEN